MNEIDLYEKLETLVDGINLTQEGLEQVVQTLTTEESHKFQTTVDVEEFMNTMEQRIAKYPEIPKTNTVILRIKLLLEEVVEFAVAALGKKTGIEALNAIVDGQHKNKFLDPKWENPNIVEIADAFADIEYVLHGAIAAFGMQDIFKECFDAVHANNMTKSVENRTTAEATVNILSNQNIKASVKETKTGRYLITRDGDNKILKPSNYKSVDLTIIVNQNIRKK